jgi:hypothetical protein
MNQIYLDWLGTGCLVQFCTFHFIDAMVMSENINMKEPQIKNTHQDNLLDLFRFISSMNCLTKLGLSS